MSNRSRYSNFGKLTLIPVFALRSFVIKREEDPDKRAQLSRATQAELIGVTDADDKLTAKEIDDLYEGYRYGRRLSLRLFTLPSESTVTVDADAFAQSLAEEFAAETRRTDKGGRAARSGLSVVDHEVFGQFIETRYRYLFPVDYLDEFEQPNSVYETRYGFIWLDVSGKYVTLLSRDEKLNRRITGALGRVLKTLVHSVTLPRDLVNRHFPLEKARSVAYFDPQHQVRRSFSGKERLYEHLETEIQAGEAAQMRLSGVFEEEITEDVWSGLGTSDRKGKIYFTRILSATELRNWAMRKLPSLIDDVRHWQASAQDGPLPAEITRLRVSDAAKRYLGAVAGALVQLRSTGQAEYHSPHDLVDLASEIGTSYVRVAFELECSECGEAASGCPQCGKLNLTLRDGQVICKTCKETVSSDYGVSLRCIRDHVTKGDLRESIVVRPTASLDDLTRRIFDTAGMTWRPGYDRFWLAGSSVYYGQSVEVGTITNINISGGSQGAVGTRAVARGFAQSIEQS